MKIDKDEYALSRADLKMILADLWAGGHKIAAIKLLRAVTGEGLVGAKAYLEGGMVDTFAVGERVKPYWSLDMLTILAVTEYNGQTHYWAKSENDPPFTYTVNDLQAR